MAMITVTSASAGSPRRRSLTSAAWAAGLVAVVWLGWRSIGSPGDRAGGSVHWAVWSMVAILAVAAGTAMLQRRRLSAELQAARTQLLCLGELLDVWQWQSNAEHRLTLLRPPRGAGGADWAAVTSLRDLCEQFCEAEGAALRARLDGVSAIDGVAADYLPATGARRRGVLCGRVRTNARGQFAGYVGTWRELLEPTTPEAAKPTAATASVAAAGDAAQAAINATASARERAAVNAESDQESFSYTVSHDLRAPIRVVEGFTKIVKEDYGRLLDRVGNDHLDRVLSAAARMNSMIDALLALSKLSSQPLVRHPVNLSQLAGYVAEDLRRQFPDRQVSFDIQPGLLVLGDPTLLRVALENLIGNAWKYTGKCAHAQVRLGRHAGDADTFSVSDNGAGFDMRFADRLFGVFQRLVGASEFPGTGVGLASVRRIVRRHGGDIWGEGEVGLGASFHFTLPQRGQPGVPAEFPPA